MRPPRAPASAPPSCRPCARPGDPPMRPPLMSAPCCLPCPTTLPDPAHLSGWQRPCGAPPGPRIGGRPRDIRTSGGPRTGASTERRDRDGCAGCVLG